MATAARAIRYIAPDEKHHVRRLYALCQRRCLPNVPQIGPAAVQTASGL